MGKLILVCGANSSGKSLYAEELVSRTRGPRYYIATMLRNFEENHARIEKHQKQRAHLNFQTLEMPYELKSAQIPGNAVVLLEDVSNLLANVIFDKKGEPEQVLEEILDLQGRCETLIAVSISGLRDEGYGGETAAYIQALNHINEELFACSQVMIEMQDREPIYRKGDETQC